VEVEFDGRKLRVLEQDVRLEDGREGCVGEEPSAGRQNDVLDLSSRHTLSHEAKGNQHRQQGWLSQDSCARHVWELARSRVCPSNIMSSHTLLTTIYAGRLSIGVVQVDFRSRHLASQI
jgi:hypothetical protein